MLKAVCFFCILAGCCLPLLCHAQCWGDLPLNPETILSWSPQEQLCGYRYAERVWPHSNLVAAASDAVALPQGAPLKVSGVSAFMDANHVAGLLVLHKQSIGL